AKAAADCGLLSSICHEDKLGECVDEILHRSEAVDPATLRAILELTRDSPSERDRSELLRSVSRDGLAARMREHARGACKARDARRATGG
ncbi:MAG: hypothetical protein ACREX6_05710, partial [Casimicrobiaceae bacterium]